MSARIAGITALRVWDSRGRPTVEAEVTLDSGAKGRGIAPAGASRGRHEAVELRDGGPVIGGYEVSKAVANVNGPIADALRGLDAHDQVAVDEALIALDGTPDKSRLGGNATIAVSMAALNAAAVDAGLPLWRYLAGDAPVSLPLPEVQIFGGGAHAGGRIDIQDFLVMPVGAKSFDEGLSMVAEVYHAAGALMKSLGRSAGVADEGGWWPVFDSNEAALDVLVQAIEKAGYAMPDDIAISIDVAASEFGSNGRYRLGLEKRELATEEWTNLLLDWLRRYPIVSIEDPIAEDDADGMRAFTAAAGANIQVIGDDFLVTNAQRVRDAAAIGACNAVLIKPNQAGTITETKRALDAAREAGYRTVVSARSGETEDTIIVHLAVGWDAGQLKVGSFARSERMAKWNEGLRIEAELGATARYAGGAALPYVFKR